MKYLGVRKTIAELGDQVPTGFTTWDADGKPVIVTPLDALDFYAETTALFREPGRSREKAELLDKLERSVRCNAGLMHEFIYSICAPAHELEKEAVR